METRAANPMMTTSMAERSADRPTLFAIPQMPRYILLSTQ